MQHAKRAAGAVVSSRFVATRPERPGEKFSNKNSNKKRILPVPVAQRVHGAERLPPAERS
jgi:hypothetical protein